MRAEEVVYYSMVDYRSCLYSLGLTEHTAKGLRLAQAKLGKVMCRGRVLKGCGVQLGRRTGISGGAEAVYTG